MPSFQPLPPERPPSEHALFVNYRGGRLTVRSVDRLVRRLCGRDERAHGHQPARAAPLVRRRTCCSAAPTCARIQELLGHAQLSTTQRYTHVNAAQLVEVYRKAHPQGEAESRTGTRD